MAYVPVQEDVILTKCQDVVSDLYYQDYMFPSNRLVSRPQIRAIPPFRSQRK
jgi:hypothetical protein